MLQKYSEAVDKGGKTTPPSLKGIATGRAAKTDAYGE